MVTTTIHLVRHGEVHNPQQILYGRLPRFRLSAYGRRQARATGRHLGKNALDALFSSPLLRARQTAGELERYCGPLKVRISSLLNEVCTSYEGRPGTDVDARDGDVYTGAAACFEQPEDILRRTLKFIQRIRKLHPGGNVAAVTHGDIVTFIVLWSKGFSATPKNKTRLLQAGYPEAYPAHASATTLIYRTTSEAEIPGLSYFRPSPDQLTIRNS